MRCHDDLDTSISSLRPHQVIRTVKFASPSTIRVVLLSYSRTELSSSNARRVFAASHSSGVKMLLGSSIEAV